MHFTFEGGYQMFLVFLTMLNSLTVDNNDRKDTNCISEGISPEKI